MPGPALTNKLAQSVSPGCGSGITHRPPVVQFDADGVHKTPDDQMSAAPLTGTFALQPPAGVQVRDLLDRKGRHRLSSDKVANFVSTVRGAMRQPAICR